jgi:three-Cys-motif partner protein
MPDRHPTIWPRKPHTAAKHAILRSYLEAWLPKLAWRTRLVFIDGFAGPGEYSGGEPGSPLVALRAATEHKADFSACELVYIFIEQDRDRFDHLEALLNEQTVPDYITWRAVHGTFAEEVGAILDDLESKGKQLAPTLVMVDPFGFTGLPMQLLARIASHPRSELLVSFMYDPIARWGNAPNLDTNMDDLCGCSDWRALGPLSPSERKKALCGLYMRQLRHAAQMQYIREFEMVDEGNRTEYFLVFATSHIEGLKAMKAAMWSVDPTGAYRFSDATDPSQLTLFTPQPDYGVLKSLIVRHFQGQDAPIEEIEQFVVVETAFRETHFRRRILTPMEKNGELSVVKTTRKRGIGYPPGTVIRLP